MGLAPPATQQALAKAGLLSDIDLIEANEVLQNKPYGNKELGFDMDRVNVQAAPLP